MNPDSILGPVLSTTAMTGFVVLFFILIAQRNVRLRLVLWCLVSDAICEGMKGLIITINVYHGNNFTHAFRIFRECAGIFEMVTLVVVVGCFKAILEALEIKAAPEPSAADIKFALNTKQAAMQTGYIIDKQLEQSRQTLERMTAGTR